MPQWDPAGLTERQRSYFSTLREGLETETGRSLAEWAQTARACPETAHRKRLAWMRAEHGLGQNRASLVLAAAFPSEAARDDDSDPLWTDPRHTAVLEALIAAVDGLEGAVVGRRKSFTAFSHAFQFAAAKPAKGGVRLGLAVPPAISPRLQPAAREGWSERLTSVTVLGSAAEVDEELSGLLRQAYETS